MDRDQAITEMNIAQNLMREAQQRFSRALRYLNGENQNDAGGAGKRKRKNTVREQVLTKALRKDAKYFTETKKPAGTGS